jgi:Protein of unknown function (DUF4089)
MRSMTDEGRRRPWPRFHPNAPTAHDEHNKTESRPMTERPIDPDAVIDAMAPLLGLVIGESSRAPVKTHLEIAARYAALLDEADLSDHEEPAPVFTP